MRTSKPTQTHMHIQTAIFAFLYATSHGL